MPVVIAVSWVGEHDHHGEPAQHVVTGAVSDETAQTPSLSQRVPATRGATANTVGCALSGSGRPVLPVAPRPTLHFRNGVIERVLLQTALTPSLSQRVPATQNKKTPCNNKWWTGIKRTVQRPPLCLHRECRLRHAPTVVAWSSLDCRCTGTKGKCLMYGVEAQTAPRRKARRADEATAIAISPRPPERPGALAKFGKSQ